MAKVNNIVTHGLQGTLQNLTFVNSKAYGSHIRAKRGTHKPAVLNETMQESSNRLLQVNQIASLIFKGISSEHKDGKLWTRLLSKLRKQLKEKNHIDVQCLLKLECHARHTLDKLLCSHWNVTIAGMTKRQMNIQLYLPEPPVYDKEYMDQFQISLHVLYPDVIKSKLKKETTCSDILNKTSYPKQHSFTIPVPAKATAYLVFLKVTECEDGVALNYPHSTGMCCVAVGIIPENQKKSIKRKAVPEKKQSVPPKLKAKVKGGRKKTKAAGRKKSS